MTSHNTPHPDNRDPKSHPNHYMKWHTCHINNRNSNFQRNSNPFWIVLKMCNLMHKYATLDKAAAKTSFAWKQAHNFFIKTSIIHFLEPQSYNCAKLSLCVFITWVLAQRNIKHKGCWYEIQGLLIHWPLSSKCQEGSWGFPFNKRGNQAYKRLK